MTCCIVGLLIMTLVGRFRRAVGLAEKPELFAPVASRPAPGQTLTAAAVGQAAPRPATAAVFRYAALAMAGCLLGGPVLVWAGLLENTGSTGMWLVRGVCYLAAIAVAVILSRSMPLWRNARGPGWLLVVAGAVLFETGVLDMHVFRVIEVDHGNLLGDMVFHNIGPALAVVGGLVLLVGAQSRRAAVAA
jgi:hypothetical protein